MTTAAPGFDTAAAYATRRARALAACLNDADATRAWFASRGEPGDDERSRMTWPELQHNAHGAAVGLLTVLADLLDAAAVAPAPRAVPVEVLDDETTRTRAEVADNPLSPDYAVRMEVGAGTTRGASTWLDADTALTLGYALVGLATEAKRRNLDAHG